MKQLLYITGSGHSGSTLLDRLLGAHPDIAALGEVHRFSLGLHRSEKPFRCDCGQDILECPFWSAVIDRMVLSTGLNRPALLESFQTTDHSMLRQPSGEAYFNAYAPYEFLPRRPEKALLALTPDWLAPMADRIGAFGNLLKYARNSNTLFDAVSEVSGASVIVDSTKNPMRLRALHLTTPHMMKVIYLHRDGRAVTNSRIKRQSISMDRAAKIWVAENRKIRLVLNKMERSHVLDVRYEQLCAAPEEEAARIFQFLGLPNAPVSLSVERHAVGGNPSRFAETRKIAVDEKWRQDLSPADLEAFQKIAGPSVSRDL